MKLTRFNYPTLQRRADKFTKSLVSFLEKYPQLKILTDNYPIDHLAIKSDGSDDYELIVQSVKPFSNQLSHTLMDNRRIATAELKRSIRFKHFGQSNILEIIEPKPEKAGTTGARFDHIEIRNPDFPAIEQKLKQLNISYKEYSNAKHQALVVVINNKNQEIKFTNANLKKIVEIEIIEGIAQKL